MHLPFLALFYVFSASVIVGHAKVITFNFTNPAILFSSNWTIAQSNVTSGSQSFAVSAFVGGFLTLNLPNGTVSAEYLGFKRNGGSAYGVCLDCVGNEGTFQVIDGHNSSLTDDEESPVVLFSVFDLDPTVSHALSVYNLPDDRFAKTGEITMHSIVLNTNSDVNNGGLNHHKNGSIPGGSTTGSGSDSKNTTNTGSNDASNKNDPTNSDGIFSLPRSGVTLTVVKTFASSATPTSVQTKPTVISSATPTSVQTKPTVASSTQDDPVSSTDTSAPQPTSTDPQSASADPQSTSTDPQPTSTANADATDTSSESSPETTVHSSSPTAHPPASSKSSTSSTPHSTGSVDNGSSANQSNGISSTKPRQLTSSALIAVIAVLSGVAVLALIAGLVFFIRRRKRSQQNPTRLPDPEDDPTNNSRTPLRDGRSPTIGAPVMRQIGGAGGGVPPERPRNPFEDTSPPTEPLDGNVDLEYPSDSTLMKKRMRTKTTSSFGNLQWVPGSG